MGSSPPRLLYSFYCRLGWIQPHLESANSSLTNSSSQHIHIMSEELDIYQPPLIWRELLTFPCSDEIILHLLNKYFTEVDSYFPISKWPLSSIGMNEIELETHTSLIFCSWPRVHLRKLLVEIKGCALFDDIIRNAIYCFPFDPWFTWIWSQKYIRASFLLFDSCKDFVSSCWRPSNVEFDSIFDFAHFGRALW